LGRPEAGRHVTACVTAQANRKIDAISRKWRPLLRPRFFVSIEYNDATLSMMAQVNQDSASDENTSDFYCCRGLSGFWRGVRSNNPHKPLGFFNY
jgi:hypothetical protein